MDDNAVWAKGQSPAEGSAWAGQQPVEFLAPLLRLLDIRLDRRLVSPLSYRQIRDDSCYLTARLRISLQILRAYASAGGASA